MGSIGTIIPHFYPHQNPSFIKIPIVQLSHEKYLLLFYNYFMLTVSHNFYTTTTAFIFAAKGLYLGLAAYYEWAIIINRWTVPTPILWAGCGVAFILSYAGLCLAR